MVVMRLQQSAAILYHVGDFLNGILFRGIRVSKSMLL